MSQIYPVLKHKETLMNFLGCGYIWEATENNFSDMINLMFVWLPENLKKKVANIWRWPNRDLIRRGNNAQEVDVSQII
jgi:hypothetical protein